MSDQAAFRYEGRRAVVVGGATGMGAAVAATVTALGAEVTVLDHALVGYPVSRAVQVDLRDRQAIDDALAEVDGPVDALFCAAGVADGTPGLMRINFIAHRHLIDRLLDDGRLGRGAAVCMISSVAGLGWEADMATILDFLATPDFEAADSWIKSHEGTDAYGFSKQAMNCYVAHHAFPLMARGVRINAICPGPTDTPLARAHADVWLGFGQDYREATGREHLTPSEMGDVMAFLNSNAARGISGVTLLVDAGHVMSSITGSFAAGKPLVDRILRRT
jgi:NAD(P)-dependent dehydrogenase (short-subunit alcohol dehydrogenase family)